MVDGTDKFQTIDITNFIGLYANKAETSEDFPSTAATYMKNFVCYDGILSSRKGRLRLNDTAYDSQINTLIPYTDRNGVEHLVFSVESDAGGLEIPDGTLKVESNTGLKKPLEDIFTVTQEFAASPHPEYVRDFKVRNGYIWVLFYYSTLACSILAKFSLTGELLGNQQFTVPSGSYHCFEVDAQGYVYVYIADDSGNDDAIVKYTFQGAEETRVVLDSVNGAEGRALFIKDDTIYVGYTDGTGHQQIDTFDLDLGSQTNIYDVADSNWVCSITVTDDGTPYIVRRNLAGTTRELRYYDGAAWDLITNWFGYLPSRIVNKEDRLYISHVDDTTTGASQAAFYVYDIHWDYLERIGNAYLSTAIKSKAWDITTSVGAETASVEKGRIMFDVDDQYIYILDGITDASFDSGIRMVVKKFRR